VAFLVYLSGNARMSIQALFRALFVPFFILLLTALYWWSITEAPSSAQRVPLVVITFIAAMATIVIVREVMVLSMGHGRHEPRQASLDLPGWVAQNRQRLIFLVLCIGYHPLFVYLGFNIANLVFLLIALPLSGLGAQRQMATRLTLSLATAVMTAVIFHLLAQVMDFNVPTSPLGL
jgi:hypothetical protein